MEWPKHLKKTDARQRVLTIFKTSEGSLSVDELHQHIADIHLTTLYRIVEDFEACGLINLTDEFQPKKKRYTLAHDHQTHYLKCVDCGKEVKLIHCPVHLEAPQGFTILRHRLEVEGVCDDCAQKRKQHK